MPAFSQSRIADLAPVFALFFVFSAALAVIRHGLFDIRSAVARSLAYALLLSTTVGFFGFFTFFFAGKIIPQSNLFVSQQVIPLVTAIALAAIFQPMKKFFDKLTNSLFFQDAYSAQDLIDELNKVIVNNIDLDQLLPKTNEIIERNIKSKFTAILIRSTSYAEDRIISNTPVRFEDGDMQRVRDMLRHSKTKVVITDDLTDQEEASDLHELLSNNRIAVIARLVSTVDFDVEGVGYLILGDKKSGNPYSRQDVKVMEILANELVIAIENALRFEEIQNFNITLQKKIEDATSELSRINDQLKKSNQKLKAMDETKDEFISMASHQLRTPLTSVKGYLSMVLEGDAGKISPMQRKLLDQAFISSQRMVYLIADLLNVSRLKTGKFLIDRVPANLAEIVQGEVDQLVETAEGRELKLFYEKPKEFPMLMLDETKTRQVIMNFIDNAIYYTPAGGHVTINVMETPESVEFTVTDNGIGVPKSEQMRLFTKFYRAGNAKKARPDGTGLGLFMAKKVITAQGGAIIFRSQEGVGSTFGFTFSKAKLAVPEKGGDTSQSVEAEVVADD